MLTVGLTGGIGSGKSAVAARLVTHGAVHVDADRLARQVVEPGTPGLKAVAETFGDRVLGPDGSLDRPALGAIVFADPEQRRRLEAITHPLIGAERERLIRAAPADAIVVHDIPLLVEVGMAGGLDVVVVVEAPVETRLDRLERRGLPREQARARMATQATDEQRRAVADFVVDNGGSLDELHARVDALWAELVSRRDATA